MEQSKPWYKSKGMWGGIFTVLGTAATAIFHTGAIPVGEATDAAVMAATGISALVAIIGRAVAKHKIG